jgi:hypothetical protein
MFLSTLEVKMKTHILFLIVLLPLLLILIGCEDTVSDNTSYTSIDSRINIKLREELSANSKKVILNCRTERIYGCINYGIDYSVIKTANNFRIKFSGIIISDICLTALGPASAQINLGNLSTGTYNLTLEVNGKTESALLIVTDSLYQINFQPGFDFKFDNTKLHRIPRYLIWGSVGYINDSLTNLANAYLDSLQILGAVQINLSAGDYGFFEIDSFGNIVTPDNHGYPFIKMYKFEYQNDLNSIKELMKRIQQQYVNQIYISCNTWQGDVFYGWTL